MSNRIHLLPRVTCPHCWNAFAPEDALWVATHADLRGDPLLGPDFPQRFLPSRFTPDGDALDARGYACQALACPKCHLGIPRPMLEMEPFFVSILGTPSCGKSFYLASLVWELRRLLPAEFGLKFGDAEPAANVILSDYERSLFLNPLSRSPVPLAHLIRKTELQGDLYDTVSYGNLTVSYPRPFIYWLGPRDDHPNAAASRTLNRVLVLYDNAGEHCLPGPESASIAATQHLARSRLLLFLFDPAQDVRFRRRCGADATLERVTNRQEAVLQETANRVRRYHHLNSTARHDRPLVVVVTKADTWSHLLDDDLAEPWVSTSVFKKIDRDVINRRSARLRELLHETCPDVVAAAEDFATRVLYVPVSALGVRPAPQPQTGQLCVKLGDIRPIGVTVPLLAALQEAVRGLIAQRDKGSKPGIKVPGRQPAAAANPNYHT